MELKETFNEVQLKVKNDYEIDIISMPDELKELLKVTEKKIQLGKLPPVQGIYRCTIECWFNEYFEGLYSPENAKWEFIITHCYEEI